MADIHRNLYDSGYLVEISKLNNAGDEHSLIYFNSQKQTVSLFLSTPHYRQVISAQWDFDEEANLIIKPGTIKEHVQIKSEKPKF